MSIALYMDVHVHRAITVGHRLLGVDVITAQEDETGQLSDSELLDRATALDRVLFSQGDDLPSGATKRQHDGVPFAGVIYTHQLKASNGRCIEDLELIDKASKPEDFVHWVEYSPLTK